MSDINSPEKNWRIILTIALSALGILFFIVQAFLLGAFWFLLRVTPNLNVLAGLPLGIFFWASVLNGILLVPILALSINEYQGKPVSRWLDFTQTKTSRVVRWAIVVWPFAVLLGWWVAGRETPADFLLGLINVIVVGLPILWIAQAAQRKLPGGSQLRKWRIFGFSITIMPVIVIVVELIAVIILAISGVLWMSFRFSGDLNIQQELAYLVDQVSLYGDDLESIVQLLKPYVLQPSVIFWGLALVGGILPIIEEIIKPIALWALAGRKIAPSEGFVGGLLCGAGFALIENISYFSNVSLAEDWLFMAIGRAGTGVLHMLASALMGWGLAVAWRKESWFFTVLTTLSAFLLHGIWNIIAVISGLVPLLIFETEPTLLQNLLTLVPIFFLLIISICGLFLINRHLRMQSKNDNPTMQHNLFANENLL